MLVDSILGEHMGNEMQASAPARLSEGQRPLPRLPDLAELVRRMAQGHQDALAQ